MRGPHDPKNPYWREYQPWDYWVYEHLVKSGYDPGYHASLWQDSQSQFWESIVAAVDQDGFLVPLLHSEEVHLEQDANPSGDNEYFGGYVIAQGILPPELSQGQQYALRAMMAKTMPEVPGWLANMHVQWAMLWSAGEVVTCDRYGRGQGGLQPNEFTYRLYDPQGQLLNEVAGSYWWELLWPDWIKLSEKLAEQSSKELDVRERDGLIYFLLFEEETGHQTLEVRNYDGRPVDEVADAHTRSRLQFDKLSAAEIAELYEMQQRQLGRLS